MSDRDRLDYRLRRPTCAAGLILVFVAAVAVPGLGAFAQEPMPGTEASPPAASSPHSEEVKPGEEPKPAEAPKPVEEPKPSKPERWNSSLPCENFSHPYQADLCQQWRQANAAEEAAAAARSSAKLSGLQNLLLGVIASILLLMLLALLYAASAARRAVRAANLVRDRQEAEARAYVDVDKLEFVETPESENLVKVKLVFKNTGQTPAFHNRFATKVGIREAEKEDQIPVMPLPERAAAPGAPRLGRNATTASIVECESIPNLADRLMKGEAVIVVWGWTEYVDVFDHKRRMAFQYLCDAEALKSGLMFKPLSRGKDAA
jgi:hypothetical protein